MTTFQAFVLGIVQGLTEFLPVSSTAHLRIVPHLLGWEDPGTAFSAVIQLGTLIAVFCYFWKDTWNLSSAAIQSLMKKNLFYSADSQVAWGIALGTIPIVVLGLTFKDFIENEARSLQLIGSTLIILAIFLYLSEKLTVPKFTIEQLGIWKIQWIGLCQALALIPGCSRSGSTIMGSLIVGLNRESAARFSFLLGLPAILGSGVFEFVQLVQEGLEEAGLFHTAVGICMAFMSGYLSIGILLKILTQYGTLPFVIYRILLGSYLLTVSL